jgi:ketosteroid isomerase-like protein
MGKVSSLQQDARLQELLDKDAIRDVIMRYVRGVDRVDLDLLRSVFHADAIEAHGPFEGRSHDWINQFDPSELQEKVRHHSLGQSLIELRGDIAYCETYLVMARSHRHGGKEPNLVLIHARYVDKFERRHGEWKISRRNAVIDHAWQVAFDEWDQAATFIRGKPYPDDIVYQLFHMEDDRGRMTHA